MSVASLCSHHSKRVVDRLCESRSMRELVDLNTNGQSIESHAKMLVGQRWASRYLVCRKPADVTFPILSVYKNATRKRGTQCKARFTLQSYVGVETSFELRRQSHTLAVLTKEHIVVLAFAELKNVIVWETWIRSACGQSHCFFMNLRSVPIGSKNDNLVNKEIRLHLHDSCFALVHGRPQEIIAFLPLKDLRIFSRTEALFAFTAAADGSPSNCYSLHSVRMAYFYRMLERAMGKSGLNVYLCKNRGDGDWAVEYIVQEKMEDGSTKKAASRAHSESFNEKYSSTRNTPLPQHYFNKEKSKSGMFFAYGRDAPSINLQRAYSMASYGQLYRGDYAQQPPQSRHAKKLSSCHSRTDYDESLQDEDEYSLEIPKFAEEEEDKHQLYVNIHEAANEHNGSIQLSKSNSKQSLASDPVYHPHYYHHHHPHHPHQQLPSEYLDRRGRRTSDNSHNSNHSGSAYHHAYAKRLNLKKQRSMVDFSGDNEDDDRYENLMKARLYTGPLKRKTSVEQLPKSSSTGALHAASPVYRPQKSANSQWNFLTHDHSGEQPPHLDNLITSETMNQSNAGMMEKPPQGLVRPGPEYVLNARGGVGSLLARRLASSVRGSFSKYDGDRTANHQYNLNIPPKVDEHPDDPLEQIALAVNKGREKFLNAERRASSVSFQKLQQNKVVLLPVKKEKPSKEKQEKKFGSILSNLFTSPRTSYSGGSTRSSNDSLSSDARSKMTESSVKTQVTVVPMPAAGGSASRSDISCQPSPATISPPAEDAPRLFRIPSSNTLTQSLGSSMTIQSGEYVVDDEEIEDDEEERAPSPPPLPVRISKKAEMSSSSCDSPSSPITRHFDYSDAPGSSSAAAAADDDDILTADIGHMRVNSRTPEPQPILPPRPANFQSTAVPVGQRKTSEHSSASETNSAPRQPLFKRYRKHRKDRRTASLTDLNTTES